MVLLSLAPQVNPVAKEMAEPESLSAINIHSVGECITGDGTSWLDAEK